LIKILILSKYGIEIKDLFDDLRDGSILAIIIHDLFGQNLGKLNKGKLKIHQICNVNTVLNYLKSQKVKKNGNLLI
jgi:hypothetical protein